MHLNYGTLKSLLNEITIGAVYSLWEYTDIELSISWFSIKFDRDLKKFGTRRKICVSLTGLGVLHSVLISVPWNL